MFGIVRLGFIFSCGVWPPSSLQPPFVDNFIIIFQAPARPPVVPSGVVLAAAPASSTNLVDIGETNAGNNAINTGNMTTKKTKNNEKALLLSDDEFQ